MVEGEPSCRRSRGLASLCVCARVRVCSHVCVRGLHGRWAQAPERSSPDHGTGTATYLTLNLSPLQDERRHRPRVSPLPPTVSGPTQVNPEPC